MKKGVILLLLVCFFSIPYLIISCRHEIPLSCADIKFKLSATKTDALLSNSNGTITVTATGGSKFQFSLNGGSLVDTGYFTGLAPFKDYRIVGHNAEGCTDTVIVPIGSFDPCQGVTINVTTTKKDASLNKSDGSITVAASGGNNFAYSINGGAFQTGNVFSNLAAGNYTVAAKSDAGCLGTASVSIGTIDPCAGVTVSITTTMVQPTGTQANGSITATATGGTGFTYSINNGAYQSGGTFSGLVAGNYTITAKNSNGCTGSATVALGTSNPCAGITVVVTATQVNPTTGLSNGSITASATGGSGFTYSLNNGAFQTSGTFSNLAAGTYTVTAKNSNGCIGSLQVTLTATSACGSVNITLTSTVSNTTPCISPANNGSISLSASGSTGFTYNMNGGAYQVSNVFPNLSAANYLMGVKDANGCTKTQSVTVGIVPQGPTFAPVRSLISSRCSGSGCHMNGGNAAGYNFDSDCNIVTYWSQINGAAVTYTLKKMPQSPQSLLTAAEKQLITNWINAGHRYTD